MNGKNPKEKVMTVKQCKALKAAPHTVLRQQLT